MTRPICATACPGHPTKRPNAGDRTGGTPFESGHAVEPILHDIRYGLRTFIREPGFAATAVLALALGIGANTAVFSVVYAILLKPLPFAHPEQLIYAHDTFPAVPLASVSWPKFLALRDGNRTLISLAAIAPGSVTITGRGDPQQISVYRVSGDFFTVFGIGPQSGRPISREDDVPNGGKVIALSHDLWQRRFGGDPQIVGQVITVDGQAYTVVSVMPRSFTYPPGAEAWVPLALPATFQGNNFLRLVGRMKPGVTLTQATADLRTVTAAYNEVNKLQRDVQVYALGDYLTSRNRRMLLVLQGAVAFVLLIACANVANLLLARSVSRQRELAIRAAIGAGRARLVRQLFTESMLLAVIGGGVGVLLASWLLRLFLALAPANFAGVQTVRIDMQVLAVTLLTALVTGLLFGLAPARRGFRVDPNGSLRDTGARGATSATAKGASRLLVIVEISAAMVLVVGAGLMIKSLLKLQAQETGFRSDGLLTFGMDLPATSYPGNEQVVQGYERLLDEIATIPGVQAAGAVNMLPLLNFGFNTSFRIVGRPPFAEVDRAPIIELRFVTPGYFDAMGMTVERGRNITATDTAASAPVMLVNNAAAKRFWPNGNPVGERISFGPGPQNENEIVGVVSDVRDFGLSTAPVIEAFFPLTQAPTRTMAMVVRTELRDPASVLPLVRARVAAFDRNLPIVKPQTMAAVVDAAAGGTRLSSMLTGVFAMLAGLLASVGIYSLIAYSVAQRTRELGIRIALGADRSAVIALIVGEGLRLAAIGLAIGLAGAWLLTGTLKTMLYEVSPLDPAILALTAAGVVAVALFASCVPAWRALHVDPMAALRAD
jgi:putative ABC transport system permease protein